MEKKKQNRMKTFVLLHILLMIYSMSGIFSKTAAAEPFLSPKFCLCYMVIISILGIYAIGWQQIIKYLPLTTAFANKAVSIIWGIIWGTIVFHETVTPPKIIGSFFVIIGVILFAKSDGGENVE